MNSPIAYVSWPYDQEDASPPGRSPRRELLCVPCWQTSGQVGNALFKGDFGDDRCCDRCKRKPAEVGPALAR